MMTTRNLRWIAIIFPIFFLGAVLTVRARFGTDQSAWVIEIILFALIVIAVVAFSTWIFGVIGQREFEIRNRTEQLSALHEAAILLTTELDLAVVLQKVVDLACDLGQARYAALGVLSPDGSRIERFVTSGLPEEHAGRIGSFPSGRGLLGVMIKRGEPIRVADINADPRASGFPKHHPQMTSMIGVPIRSKGRTIGDLYLVDKGAMGGGPSTPQPFTKRDQQLLEMFATQAAIAIENAQLYRQVQQLAVFQERERFGMDLHDGIIQSIYAIGLMLEGAQHNLATSPDASRKQITRALEGLNDVIRDIRNYILDLRPQRFQGRDLVEGVDELARDLRANSFLEVEVSAGGFDQSGLTPESTVEILHVIQEAMINVRKHARATKVEVLLERKDGVILVSIKDDGVGMDIQQAERSLGNGLHNMRERARHLKAKIDFIPGEDQGTTVRLEVPQ